MDSAAEKRKIHALAGVLQEKTAVASNGFSKDAGLCTSVLLGQRSIFR